MNFVHTYWSIPSQSGRWNIDKETAEKCNIAFYALSLAYLKLLNQTVILYTDNYGKQLFNDLPYDNIYEALDNIDNKDSAYCWAYGKIFSLKHHDTLGDVFIDGDVFIKSQNCLNSLYDGLNYDAMFQGLEYSMDFYGTKTDHDLNEKMRLNRRYIYYDHAKHMLQFDYPTGMEKLGQYAYNAGIIMFNNQEYKDKFLCAYDYMYNQLSNSCDILMNYEKDREFCPDLICEQRFLYECGKDYNIKTLLNYQIKDDKGEQTINQQANIIGYQHVIGHHKYKQLDACLKKLKEINLEIYNIVIKKLTNY